MQIKRFEARDMTEALRLVKHEFGPEAVILSARSLKKDRGIFGSLKKQGVEVTAATDNYYKYAKRNNLINKKWNFGADQVAQSDFSDLAGKKRVINSIHGGIKAFRNRHNPLHRRNQIHQNGPRKLFSLYQQMLFQGVSSDLALELIGEVNRAASSDGLFENEELKPFLVSILEEMGVTSSRIRMKNGKQKIAAFIGPTGVGKTTTIAKLAAGAQAMQKKNRLAFISVDTHRIGGVAQLKVYAKIIGIPIEVASNNKELKESIKRFRDKDLVLIDTAGVGGGNEYQIDELKRILENINSLETHLLLSAGTKDRDLEDISKKFNVIPINRMIFAKLDESITYGNLLNQLVRTKIPVSYYTNGQKIPENIEGATLEKLVDLIINNEKELDYLPGISEVSADDMTVFERMLEEINNKQGVQTLQVV